MVKTIAEKGNDAGKAHSVLALGGEVNGATCIFHWAKSQSETVTLKYLNVPAKKQKKLLP